MTDDQILAITMPLTVIFVVGFITGGILYDNHLDVNKQKHAFDLGCHVTEYSKKVEYYCNDIKITKRTQLQQTNSIDE